MKSSEEAQEAKAERKEARIERTQEVYGDALTVDPERGATIRARVSKYDVMKFVGLLVFLAICGLAVWFLWPYIGVIFEKGGVHVLVDRIHEAGAAGVLVMLLVQLLQIIVAFVPGEVVQVAAGMVYGTWGGLILLICGCILSSAVVFLLVRKLGAPFVQSMVPTKYLEKFKAFEATGKLDTIVFVLFLIPGLPKDVFTYLVPLTDMPMGRFLLLATLARIPAMLGTTFASKSLAHGDYLTGIIVFAVGAALAIAGILLKDRIMDLFGKRAEAQDGEE